MYINAYILKRCRLHGSITHKEIKWQGIRSNYMNKKSRMKKKKVWTRKNKAKQTKQLEQKS